jgi:hypothetical protein
MKEALKAKLAKLIQEEQKSAVDPEFLNKLHSLAAGDILYDRFTPAERNTLNDFFREVRNYLFEELLTGNYGAQIIIDAIIVLSFEVGYKLKERETQPAPPPP